MVSIYNSFIWVWLKIIFQISSCIWITEVTPGCALAHQICVSNYPLNLHLSGNRGDKDNAYIASRFILKVTGKYVSGVFPHTPCRLMPSHPSESRWYSEHLHGNSINSSASFWCLVTFYWMVPHQLWKFYVKFLLYYVCYSVTFFWSYIYRKGPTTFRILALFALTSIWVPTTFGIWDMQFLLCNFLGVQQAFSTPFLVQSELFALIFPYSDFLLFWRGYWLSTYSTQIVDIFKF